MTKSVVLENSGVVRGGDGGVAISKSTAAALSTPCAVPMAFSASESGASVSGTSMRISSAL